MERVNAGAAAAERAMERTKLSDIAAGNGEERNERADSDSRGAAASRKAARRFGRTTWQRRFLQASNHGLIMCCNNKNEFSIKYKDSFNL